MSDERSYVVQNMFSPHQLEHCPIPPSRMFLEAEARMAAEMARMVHMDGRRFRDWPTFTLVTEFGLGGGLARSDILLRAEVKA